MKNIEFKNLTDKEILRGVELLVSPEDLTGRDVLISILRALDFNAQDVADQLKDGSPLNAGPVLCLS